MIENSYLQIASDGKVVFVRYFEDDELREGPATFPARYASFAGITAYCETQFNHRRLTFTESIRIQGFLGSPWPHGELTIKWGEPQGADNDPT